MAQEMIEKRRSRARTPRATQPVLARMPPKSIRKMLAIRKIRHPLTHDKFFADFSTVAHALHGIKEKYRRRVVALTAVRARSRGAHTVEIRSELSSEMLFELRKCTQGVMFAAPKRVLMTCAKLRRGKWAGLLTSV